MKAYLEPAEIEQLENAGTNLRDRLLIRVLFHLGCRVSEALSVQVQDIDLERGLVTIQHLKVRMQLGCSRCGMRLGKSHVFCPKCGDGVGKAVSKELEHRRVRTLPVDSDTLDMLRDYKERLEYVFLAHDLSGETNMYSGSNASGMEVIRYLEHEDPTEFDCKFIIHSWNIDAAIKMTERLAAKGYHATQQPFGS